jgi:hypothetical protein
MRQLSVPLRQWKPHGSLNVINFYFRKFCSQCLFIPNNESGVLSNKCAQANGPGCRGCETQYDIIDVVSKIAAGCDSGTATMTLATVQRQ